jgi:hypothetical protein
MSACPDRRLAQRLQSSSWRAAPATLQDGTWIRPGFDRQRNGQTAALFADQLESLPLHRGDVRLNIHVDPSIRTSTKLKNEQVEKRQEKRALPAS